MKKGFLCICLSLCALVFALAACEEVKVTGVTLDKTTASVEVDSGFSLKATVAPEKAKNKSVTWASDKPGTVTVSATGWAEGIEEGTAIITVTTADGSFTATCTVTVTPATGKTRAQVKAAFESEGYEVKQGQDASTSFMPGFTFEKGEYGEEGYEGFVAIFFTDADIAAVLKTAYHDGVAEALGYTCKQEGRILYYGTGAAIEIFENI